MKKRFLCILALLLGLTLCGCDTATSESNSTETTTVPTAPTIISENADGETVVLEYDLAVQMTLQSDFTLYLDGDMNLVSIEGTDEEGKNLLSGLDFTGKPYAEGMDLVLNAALEQGILADQGKVYFTVTCDDFSTELMETLFASVMEFEQDNGIFVFIDWDLVPVEEPDFEANSLYNLQKIEEGDQTIYLDKAPSAHPYHGPQTVYTYYSEFPVFIDSNLVRTKMLCFNENGTWIVEYFEGNRTTKSIEPFDGFLQVSEHKNGMLAFQSRKYEDGSYSFEEVEGLSDVGPFIPTKSFGCSVDGMQYAYTHHSNGNVATEKMIGSDGSSSQRTYDENGNEIDAYQISKFPDGTYFESEYKNGELVYQKTVNPDGTYQEGRFENGNWTYTEGTIEPTDPANE